MIIWHLNYKPKRSESEVLLQDKFYDGRTMFFMYSRAKHVGWDPNRPYNIVSSPSTKFAGNN